MHLPHFAQSYRPSRSIPFDANVVFNAIAMHRIMSCFLVLLNPHPVQLSFHLSISFPTPIPTPGLRNQSFSIDKSFLSRNGSAQHLCPEKATLSALNDLLVDAHGRVVHDDGAGLVVDLGVDAGVADQVDDPFLAFIMGKAEAGGEVPIILSAYT